MHGKGRVHARGRRWEGEGRVEEGEDGREMGAWKGEKMEGREGASTVERVN